MPDTNTKTKGETTVENHPDTLRWASGRDGSIEIEWGALSIAFPDLGALDDFLDALGDVRNEIADAIS